MVAGELFRWLDWWLTQHPTVKGFQWIQHQTFGSPPSFLFSAVATYVSTVLCLWLFMRNREPVGSLRLVTGLHNLFLLLLSLVMAVGCSLSAARQMPNINWLFCFPPGTEPSGPVFFWCYIFYLSKIFEFSDTVFILLKKKPLTFLHVYHHAVVVVMCFLWLQHVQSLLVIALVTNASVHTLMYTYYLCCSVGHAPKWKRMVTDCQILQFLFSIAVSTVLLWEHFSGGGIGCCGMKAWGFNAVFNVSLLILFFNFHSKNYRGRSRHGNKKQH
ncbi:Elongation of fatty acids protein 3-like [Nymphaea thermarum]|nr:Elongation of fatty acids protein 3-like [Nymphaea thermarum]